MNTKLILSELKQERNRLDKVIAALEALNGTAPKPGTSFEFGQNVKKGRRGGRKGKMSAAGRRKISEMMKARWAARRKAKA